MCGEDLVNFKAVKRKLTESQLVSSFTHVNQVLRRRLKAVQDVLSAASV